MPARKIPIVYKSRFEVRPPLMKYSNILKQTVRIGCICDQIIIILDGGSPISAGQTILNGGNSSTSGGVILSGGKA